MKYFSFEQNCFLDELRKINSNLDFELMKKGYYFAQKAHLGQKRNSGEDYLTHPACVCHILAKLNLEAETLTAGLLHDVLEDTAYELKDIRKEFGEEIADLVNGVTKFNYYPYASKKNRPQIQAENYRKLLISISKDVRVLLIKLADRLHNMRTLDYMSEEKRKRIARETLDIYAPLANRFGIAKIQWELEDLAFKYLYPQQYHQLVKLVSIRREERESYINDINKEIKIKLKKNRIEAQVIGRSKHFYSIYKKSTTKKIRFEEILDLIGIRIIVPTVEDCYKSLGIIQTEFTPLKNSLKDYILQPKSNNYQSIHLVVSDIQNRKVEIQIRTKQMHYIAEEGIAAHWRYKELYHQDQMNRKGEIIVENLQSAYHEQLQWIRKFLKKQQDSDANSFLDSLKLNLFPDIIVVRTPQNDYIELRKESTCLDFAFKIHTEVGFHCIGALINGVHKPVRTKLKTGDIVQILTSPQAKPSKDWLKFITSSKAKQKIRSYFREIEWQDATNMGKELFQKRSRKYHLRIKTEDEILSIARKFKINDIRTFYAALGNKDLTFDSILRILNKDTVGLSDQESDAETIVELKDLPQITIEDIDQVLVRFAKCCNPKPGDEIVGYTTRGRGVTIHRKNCSNPGFLHLRQCEPERIIRVAWKKEVKKDD